MLGTWRRPVGHQVGTLALEVTDLTVRYGEVVALEGVSFQVASGEQVAVVGPNGSGKSTLLMAIAGLVTPARGQVAVYGSGPAGHCCIAYVPQRLQVDWAFPVTVRDVVMMGRTRHVGWLRRPGPEDRAVVEESLQAVGLPGLAGRQIGELSGGQRQRAFIARALAQEARLMLLDEPLAGLDWPSQQEVLDTLAALRTREVTVLLSTHNLNLAGDRFDRVLLLNRRLVADGSPAEVLTEPHLTAAYGDQMHVVHPGGHTLLGDTCCSRGQYE
ncbi:MAG: metal ABC transporter ATP-binding protein [Anaerolineae bacterium]|jgi:manganese/iron transport system ATP-binding protein